VAEACLDLPTAVEIDAFLRRELRLPRSAAEPPAGRPQ